MGENGSDLIKIKTCRFTGVDWFSGKFDVSGKYSWNLDIKKNSDTFLFRKKIY